MEIKEEIINVLKALAPQIDKSKAKLELDTSAVSISRLLMESKGLELIEYICENLEYGELPIYSMNKFLGFWYQIRLVRLMCGSCHSLTHVHTHRKQHDPQV